MRKGSHISIPRTAFAAAVSIAFVYPLFFMVSTAVRPSNDYVRNHIGFPTGFTTEHLRAAWHGASLGSGMANSTIAVPIGVVICLAVTSAGAFWVLLHGGRLARITLAVLAGAWTIPFVVFVIPLFVLLNDVQLTNNLFVLGVVYGASNAPFGLYFLHTYYRNALPLDVLEASRVDGASALQQYLRIVLPLSRPALGTLGALAFVWTWGELLLGLVLIRDPGKFPLTVAASTLVGRETFPIQDVAAAALIAALPMLLVFLLAQRAIVRGFTAGIGK